MNQGGRKAQHCHSRKTCLQNASGSGPLGRLFFFTGSPSAPSTAGSSLGALFALLCRFGFGLSSSYKAGYCLAASQATRIIYAHN